MVIHTRELVYKAALLSVKHTKKEEMN